MDLEPCIKRWCRMKKAKNLWISLMAICSTMTIRRVPLLAKSGIGGITVDGNGNYVVDIKSMNKGVATANLNDFWNTAIDICRKFIVVVTSVLALAFIVVFLINIFQMPTCYNNPKKRAVNQSAILWSFIGCAIFGGTSVLLGFSFGLLR